MNPFLFTTPNITLKNNLSRENFDFFCKNARKKSAHIECFQRALFGVSLISYFTSSVLPGAMLFCLPLQRK